MAIVLSFMSEIEWFLRVLLIVVTIGYTVHKWHNVWKNKNDGHR